MMVNIASNDREVSLLIRFRFLGLQVSVEFKMMKIRTVIILQQNRVMT